MFSLLNIFASLLVIANSKPSWDFKGNIKYTESVVNELRLQNVEPTAFQKSQDDFVPITQTLKFHTFGQNYSIPIVAVKSIFSPDFKLYSISEDGDDPTIENELPSELPGVFFVAANGPGSMYLENVDGQLLVEGIIDSTLRIRTLNGVHKAFKLEKEEISPAAYLHDHVYMAIDSPVPVNIDDDFTAQPQSKVPDTVTIELMPIFDNFDTEAFDKSGTSKTKYLGIFWNAVQNRYVQAKNPAIKISICAALSVKKELTFIKDAMYAPKLADANKMVYGFGQWLYTKQKTMPHYDVAMMHLGFNMGAGGAEGGVLGVAFTGTVCSTDAWRKSKVSSGVFRDPECLYSGEVTAAHELAHILGSPHDGSVESADCPKEDHYVMSPAIQPDAHAWQFSKCSLRNIQKTISRSAAECLRDEPKSKYPMLNDHPTTDLDKICKVETGISSSVYFTAVTSPSICASVPCTGTSPGMYYKEPGAPEGTPCKDVEQGFCKAGNCVKDA